MHAILRSQFFRFAVCGGVAAAVNILTRILLSEACGYSVAIVVSYLVGMTTAFGLMKAFVFDQSGRTASSEYVRFFLVNAVALVQVWAVSLVLARWLFPGIGYTWKADTTAHVIGVLSPIATSYIGHKSFTFAAHETR